MTLDVLHLLSPAPVIHAECFNPAVAGDLVKAGLREQKQCAALGLLQPEFEERRRLLRVIDLGIDGIRMPGKGKKPFRLHFLYDGLPLEMLVAGIGNLAARHLARYERTIQLHAKPLAKLTVVRQGAPD